MFFGGEWVFKLIFGSSWALSVKAASNLSFLFLSQLVVSPLGIVLIAIKKIKLNAIWQYSRFVITALILIVFTSLVETTFRSIINLFNINTCYIFLLLFNYYNDFEDSIRI